MRRAVIPAAQARTDQAEAARAAVEAGRDATVAAARAKVGQQVSAAEADADRALARSARAEQVARVAAQDAAPGAGCS